MTGVMSHDCPIIRKSCRLQSRSALKGGRPPEAVRETLQKRKESRLNHKDTKTCTDRRSFQVGEWQEQKYRGRKNKQMQTNHDMLQETMYQLFD